MDVGMGRPITFNPPSHTEAELRQLIVKEALTWMGTPFHNRAAVKGAGVECGWLIFGVMRDLGMVPADYVMPEYSIQFWMHRDDEVYVGGALRIGFAETTFPPKPGDLAIARMGRQYAHGGFVTEWPMVVHSDPHHSKVVHINATLHPRFTPPKRYFTLFHAAAPVLRWKPESVADGMAY